MDSKTYVCIDLKSFYASVECRERGLDPLTANLVVADPERTEKTICLAVSPAMKALGVPGRCRVFEIPAGIDYIMAPPRMQLYIDYSAEIYAVYLKYISKSWMMSLRRRGLLPRQGSDQTCTLRRSLWISPRSIQRTI